MDKELACAAVCTHQMVALFCVKWRHCRHLENITAYRKSNFVNRYAFTRRKNSAKFHPDLIWNDGALDFFEEAASARRRRTTTRTTRRWVAICDQFLIQKLRQLMAASAHSVKAWFPAMRIETKVQPTSFCCDPVSDSERYYCDEQRFSKFRYRKLLM